MESQNRVKRGSKRCPILRVPCIKKECKWYNDDPLIGTCVMVEIRVKLEDIISDLEDIKNNTEKR
jgi:hypothetical protein